MMGSLLLAYAPSAHTNTWFALLTCMDAVRVTSGDVGAITIRGSVHNNAALKHSGGFFHAGSGAIGSFTFGSISSDTLTGPLPPLRNNTAFLDGGVVAASRGILSIMVDGALVANNSAGGNGGVWAVTESGGELDSVSILRSTFLNNNAAGGSGGIIYSAQPLSTSGTGSTTNNSSAADGAGLNSSSSSRVVISDSLVTACSAGLDGGVAALGAVGSFTLGPNATVEGVSAGRDGGTLYAAGVGELLLVASAVRGTTARRYGGLAAVSGGVLGLGRAALTAGSAVADASAGSSGGAFYLVGRTGSLEISGGSAVSAASALGGDGGFAALFGGLGQLLVSGGSCLRSSGATQQGGFVAVVGDVGHVSLTDGACMTDGSAGRSGDPSFIGDGVGHVRGRLSLICISHMSCCCLLSFLCDDCPFC